MRKEAAKLRTAAAGAVVLTLACASVTLAIDWRVDILGPHGRVSFGDRPFVEYANVEYVPSYYDVLSPYGEWVMVPMHGEVWLPYVEVDWRPYTYGQWIFTDAGWMWVSWEPWGYIPHHYGDWRYLGGYGWVWVPGYTWAPARVAWFTSGSYIGWYPQGAFVDVDIDVDLVNVVRVDMFTSPRLPDVLIPSPRIDREIHAAIRMPEAFRHEAPDRTFIQQHVREPIRPVPLEQHELKVGDRSIKMAAPRAPEVRERQIEQAKVVAPKVVKKESPRPVKGGRRPGLPHGAETDPGAGAVQQPKPHSEPRPVPQAEPEPGKAPKSEPHPEARPERGPKPAPAPEARPEKGPKPAPAPEARPEKGPKPAPAPEARPEKGPKPAPAPEAAPVKVKPGAKAGGKPPKPEAPPESKAPSPDAKAEPAAAEKEDKGAKGTKAKKGAKDEEKEKEKEDEGKTPSADAPK